MIPAISMSYEDWKKHCVGVDHFCHRLHIGDANFPVNPYDKNTPEYAGYDHALYYHRTRHTKGEEPE